MAFERMTRQDYLHVLGSKMTGLQLLHVALQQQPLDFFVILSSYTGLVGNPGQSNYAAASTYQDAFARWRTAQGFPTRSIDLGIIQDAGYVFENPASTEHLRKSGIKAVPLDTLLALFEHCVYSPPRDSSSSQIAIGWSPEMAENIDNSLFSQLISSKAGSPDSSGLQGSPDQLLEAALHSTRPRNEVVSQLETTICQYVSRVLGVPIEDVDPLQSMSRHGGDSLVLAEFRNWLQKGVGAPLLMNKDLGQLPLRELAEMAVDCVRQQPTRTITRQTSPASNMDISLRSERLVKQAPSAALPPLPLPTLEETVQRYLQTVRPLVSASEFAATSQKAQDFLHPTGPAWRLQRKLQDKKDNPKIRNWLDGIYAEVRYLRDRRPLVPFSSYFGSHKIHGLDSSDQGSPAVRAAIISWSAFRFKTQYEHGDLPCDTINEQPLCMDSYRWLFNACRVPGLKEDVPAKWPSQGVLIAMRNGHMYKIPLSVDGKPATIEQLAGAFNQVIRMADSKRVSRVGVLTNGDRDVWSRVSHSLLLDRGA